MSGISQRQRQTHTPERSHKTWVNSELRHGAEKSQSRDKALSTIDQLSRRIQIAPLIESTGQHYGQIRAELEKAGTPIGNNDLWIAAHARSEGWIVVTNNEREFSRVAGLQVENWVI